LNAYRNETHYSPWLLIASVLGALDNLASRERFHGDFVAMARRFFEPVGARMGWEKQPSDGELDALLRALALRSLGGYGDPAAIEQAKDRFARFVRGQALDPDLRQTVYSLVAENGHAREWAQLRKLYRASDLQEEKTRLLRAIGCCRDEEVLREFLDYSLSAQVRSQDTWIAITSVAAHPVGRPLAWKFVKKNWKTFLERYHGGGLNLLNRIIGISSGFTSRPEFEDAQNFFKRHRVPGIERAINKSLEAARANIRWLERDRSDLQRYFAGRA
jgi:puromycin-sensitive aminopeptidase